MTKHEAALAQARVEGRMEGLAHAAEARRHNGWRNYETWNVALHIDNEEGSYRYWSEQTESAYLDAEATEHSARLEVAIHDLAGRLRAALQEGNPLSDSCSCYADLLSGALDEVDWREIASNWLAERHDEQEQIDADTVAQD